MEQAGAFYKLWAHAVVMFGKNLSMTRINEDGQTPYRVLREEDAPRPVPFGCRAIFLEPLPQEDYVKFLNKFMKERK